MPFFSAAKPSDQGEESIVLVLVVLVLVGGPFLTSPCSVFRSVKSANFFLKMGVKKANLLKIGVKRAKLF